jgi:hypothetical protein
VSFDYLANLRKFKKKLFCGMGRCNEDRGVLINEKPNQGVQDRKNVGLLHSIFFPTVKWLFSLSSALVLFFLSLPFSYKVPRLRPLGPNGRDVDGAVCTPHHTLQLPGTIVWLLGCGQ